MTRIVSNLFDAIKALYPLDWKSRTLEALNIAESTLYKKLNGQRSITLEEFLTLSEHFGVSIDDLSEWNHETLTLRHVACGDVNSFLKVFIDLIDKNWSSIETYSDTLLHSSSNQSHFALTISRLTGIPLNGRFPTKKIWNAFSKTDSVNYKFANDFELDVMYLNQLPKVRQVKFANAISDTMDIIERWAVSGKKDRSFGVARPATFEPRRCLPTCPIIVLKKSRHTRLIKTQGFSIFYTDNKRMADLLTRDIKLE